MNHVERSSRKQRMDSVKRGLQLWKFVSFDERTKDRKYPGEKDVFQRRFILVPKVSMRV